MVHTPFPGIDAILLDRDGVINRERKDYVKCWEEFEFLPGALQALKLLAAYSWPIVVITNQSVIGRNLVSEDEIMAIHCKLIEAVYKAGGRIDAIFMCPHRPDEHCPCRKPKPGLLNLAAQAFRLDLTRCIFIGDSLTDYQAAVAVKCQTILVNSGCENVERELANLPRVRILPDLCSAVLAILDSSTEQWKVEM